MTAPAFEIVHADAALLVALKPAGLLAVPGRGEDKQDCLIARVRARFDDALVVHRLDQATSGLMVFARGLDAQRALSRAFEQRAVDKRYVAVVAGRLEAPEWFTIDRPLICDWPNRPRQIVDEARGKPSRTRCRTLACDAAQDLTRVELEPLTGRSHQLRVHLQSIGHPILGDALYAPPDRQRHGIADGRRLLLHASRLAFAHPRSGDRCSFESPAPF
ncbi:RluA family pseudouridine synthase [Caldimonas sp. KR1-144]|uniref:RluA family pseudouridine synthase n=1 Tax=Caldimonas sp. KR1-144 TaxID=3400911 RepID=UPI003C048D29